MTAGLRRDDDAEQFPPAPGEWIGPYRLIEQLGEGGMGVVHLALDGSGRAVAVKVLRDHIAHDADARSRLAREVQALARVQDARVAAVLDADTEGPRPYIVTRYVPGPALDRVVSDNGPLRGDALLRVGRGLSHALQAIHGAGVIHRDLKPANVLVLDDDPVVIDFGIAHIADDIRLTMTGLVMGTPGYLSPEVVEGAPVTEATDWWGWAATLAFAASGVPPFGRGPMDVVLDRVRRGQADLSGVDPRLVPLLRAALSPTAAGRPHADEVVEALDRYAVGGSATLALPVVDATSDATFDMNLDQIVTRSPSRSALGASAQAFDQTFDQAFENGVGFVDSREQSRGRERNDGQTGPPQPQASGSEPDWESESDSKSDWESDWEAARDGRPGQPDPRIGRPPRVGTLFALTLAILGVVAVRPVVGAGLIILWSWCARLADRSVTSLVRRRHVSGRRRRDVPLAVGAGPWHVIISAAATVIAGLLPAIVAIASTFSAALAVVAVSGGEPAPKTSLPLAVGGLFGLLMAWWGPGGASLRRGSRSLVRGMTPGPTVTRVVAVLLVLVGAGLGVWAWQRHGVPDLWPWVG